MNINEFLLARIEQDEEEAARMGCTEYYDGGWSNEHEIHIRKECAAKRAVIQYSPPKTLRYLAAVYSDHPDYNPDWAL